MMVASDGCDGDNCNNVMVAESANNFLPIGGYCRLPQKHWRFQWVWDMLVQGITAKS